MIERASRTPPSQERRRWSTLSIVIAGSALLIALSGSAVAAKGSIQSKDIARGAVTSKTIKNGSIMRWDLNRSTRMWMRANAGARGAKGDAGTTGTTGIAGIAGTTGSTGASGTDGADGATGSTGASGTDGADGATGSTGASGTDGADGATGSIGASGTDGSDGADGSNGSNGADGTDGILAQQSATAGLTPLPTASPPTVVVEMEVPAGNYVVWAKTQLSHTGAGDSIDCMLKAGGTTVDQVSMKTLPALAAIPASLQAVTTTSPTHLSLECDVLTADGSADFNSLIAVPTG
jgi:hypothetical protein